MQDIITSYLLLNRQVTLPGIGSLSIVSKPAKIDTTGNMILPPAEEFIFSEDVSNTSPEFVKYISRKKNIETNVAEDELEKFCEEWKQKIDSGNELCFETIGCLRKNEEGIIFLKQDNNVQYLNSVYSEIIQQVSIPVSAADNIIKDEVIGDDIPESIPLTSDGYYSTTVKEARQAWLKWTIILFVAALVTLLFHYYGQRSSTSSAGNQLHFFVASPDSTYFIPKQ